VRDIPQGFKLMPEIEYNKGRMIITYNPKRARKDKRDRDQLIEKLR
jgi:hypothetical protein